MRSVFILGAVFFILFSCSNAKKEVSVATNNSVKIDAKKWPKKTPVTRKAREILETWPEYNAFTSSFDPLYKVEEIEDIILVIEDLIEKQKLLEKSKYPEEFNTPQIKSRQKIVLTYLLKTKGDLQNRVKAENSILELIDANNAMRNQFNVILNNPLDNKLILDEK